MNERWIDCEQGSHDWFQARMGCVTSARVADVVKKRKPTKDQLEKNIVPEELAARRDMRYEIVGEMISNRHSEHYVSRWMKEGKEREPMARTEYDLRFGVAVQQIGFIYHPTIKRAGCSPDGLIGNDGMVEFKCPKIDTHLQYWSDGVIPDEYLPQMLWQLACEPDRLWVDFVSFYPDLPEDFQIFKRRLPRNDKAAAVIASMEAEVRTFLDECVAFENHLRCMVKDDLSAILTASLEVR